MAELKALYKKLRRKGYWPVQIYQLIFLYMDCKEKEREKEKKRQEIMSIQDRKKRHEAIARNMSLFTNKKER